MSGKIVLGMNPYREICTLHLAGKMLIDKNLVLKLTQSAAENAKKSVEVIKNALEKDENARKSGQEIGLIHSMKRLESILNNERKPSQINVEKMAEKSDKMEIEEQDSKISDKGNGVFELKDSEDSEEEVQILKGQDLK